MSLRSNKIKVPEEISVRKFFDYFKDTIDLQLICGEDGFDRIACDERCTINEERSGKQVCGKCLNGMPCTFTDPSA